MKLLSFFSGVGGLDLGFVRAGFEIVGHSEVDPHASGVLTRRFPGVPNFGDVNDIDPNDLPDADVWGGGFPCQDLSLAGRRAGLAGARSGLWFAWHRLLRVRRPRWVVIENVPGLLSSSRGRDLAVVLGGLTGRLPDVPVGGWRNAGFARGVPGWYSVAWRVLDAQYFGVAQQRRRVFIVASLGDGRCAQVLFEREGGGWYPPPSREARANLAQAAPAGAGASDPTRGDVAPGQIVFDPTQIPSRHNRSHPRAGAPSHTLPAQSQGPLVVAAPDEPVFSIRTAQTGSNGWGVRADVTGTLDGTGGGAVVDPSFAVFGGNDTRGERLAAATLTAHGSGRYDFETESMVVCDVPDLAACLNSGGNRGGFRTEPGEHLVPVSVAIRGRDGGRLPNWEETGSIHSGRAREEATKPTLWFSRVCAA